MDVIPTIVLLSLAAAPIAVVAGWLASRGHGRLGPLVSAPAGVDWWRTTMPWPHGVQEDDEVKWNFAEPVAADPTTDDRPARTVIRPTVRIR